MNFSPLNIFGLVMSGAYVFFGLLFLTSPFMTEMVAESTYRKVIGGALLGYGLFRISYFVRKIRGKI